MKGDFWGPGAVLFLDLGTSEKGTFQFVKIHQDLHLNAKLSIGIPSFQGKVFKSDI